MDDKLRLYVDLNEKLDRLKLTLEQPGLFIAEHFASIRNLIDLEAEQFIQELDDDDSTASASDLDATNSIRMRFIEFLDKNEANLYAKLKESSASSTTTESFSVLEKRVKELSSTIEFTGLIEMEEAYLQLALDIIDATNEIERRLLDNQTFAYVPWNGQDSDIKIGNLVYLSEDYLDRNELSCLRQTGYFDLLPCIFEALQASSNAWLAVGVCRPFVLTRKTLIVSKIARQLNSFENSTAGKILYLVERPSKTRLDISFDEAQFYQELKIHPEEIFNDSSRKSIDAVQLQKLNFGSIEAKRFSCFMSHNKLKRFEIADSLIQSFDSLDLSENQLETLDVEQLAKANKLRRLNLVNACLPDTKFSLDFLASLTELTELNLTLPNAPIDFEVLKVMKNMEILRLRSSNSFDSDIERPRLTHEHFKQLSVMPKLTTLELFNFKIESLQKEMFGEFAQLTNLSLIDNEIVHIEDGVFEQFAGNKWNFVGLAKNSIRSIGDKTFKGHSEIHQLDLSYNQIEQLPSRVFSELSSMRNLVLNNNSIQHLTRGIFADLNQLVELNLQDNLIEFIQADTFKDCYNLRRLYLNNCRLKSIDSTLFDGLEKMFMLDLSDNNIETFEVVNDNCRSSVKGIMSPVEYELVQMNLFRNMSFLEVLNLKGNKLEKLDLNCFCNLTRLTDLDVSSNRICELNEKIRPGILSSLITLDLSDNQLTRVSRCSFGESRGICTLNLSKNRIERLDKNFFKPFGKLTQLELQNNNLSMKITTKTFARCFRLECMNLMGNPDVSVENGALSGLGNLCEIHLEIRQADSTTCEKLIENMLHLSMTELNLSLINSSIEGFDAFKRGNRVWSYKRLDLSLNQIRSINNESFSCFDRFFDLDLSSNQIETLDDPSVFEGISVLRKLSLRGNNLNRIHRRVFKCLSKLYFLDLSHNPALTNIDAGIFRGLFSLETLNLAGNNIASFDLNVLLRSCQQLKFLDLSNNQLDNKSINEESMSGSTAQNLKELILANNRLERMDFVRNLYRLEKLDLSGNKIESVTSPLGVNLLGRLVKLNHVNLRDNEIKSLYVQVIFSHLKYQLKFLDLSNNPFNSKLNWLFERSIKHDCYLRCKNIGLTLSEPIFHQLLAFIEATMRHF